MCALPSLSSQQPSFATMNDADVNKRSFSLNQLKMSHLCEVTTREN